MAWTCVQRHLDLYPETYDNCGGDIYSGSLMEVTWSAATCPVSRPVLQQERLLVMESLLEDIRMAPLPAQIPSSDCSGRPHAFHSPLAPKSGAASDPAGWELLCCAACVGRTCSQVWPLGDHLLELSNTFKTSIFSMCFFKP